MGSTPRVRRTGTPAKLARSARHDSSVPGRTRALRRRITSVGVAASHVLALIGITTLTSSTPAAAGPAPVMFGYVPLPADQFATTMATISASQATVSGTTIDFTVGITNAGAGAIMYYDDWEDGYEADIANPVQATTLIFGDGNGANGNAATFCSTCAGDLLPAGAALVMRNNVTTPRGGSPATGIFDGRDKVASTRGFALTAGGFATNVGSLLASVVSSYDTSKYGYDFVAPVGEDTAVPASTSNANAYAGLFVQASQDNTAVTIDTNADGAADVTQTINAGQVVHVNGTVLEGATVHATKPVQVHEATGDTTASYESRWYTLFPNNLLSNQYMSPVGSATANYRTVNYLYNPNNAAITVTPTCGRSVNDGATTSGSPTVTSATANFVNADVGSLIGGAGIPAGARITARTNATTVTISANATATATGVALSVGCPAPINIPANSGVSFMSPNGLAVSFQSNGPNFVAVAGVGAQSGALPGAGTDASSNWDWGYTLTPVTLLTTQVVIGFAPGNSNLNPSLPAGNRDDDPVWITTLTPTTLHVDFDGDPATGAIAGADCFGANHDQDIVVGAGLTSTRIFDNTDGTMTGARIYTCDGTKISGAWGEDSANAPFGTPGFDAGYTVIPTTTMVVNKSGAVVTDTNGDGRLSPGDIITYDISISDAGSLAFTNVNAQDTIPAGTQYVADSTNFDDGSITHIPDDVVPPAATTFPLDETGAGVPGGGGVAAGATVHFTFSALVLDPYQASGTILHNTACGSATEASNCGSVDTPLTNSDLSLTKSVTSAATFVGTNATFRVSVTNAGPDTATGVEVTDLLPAGLTYVSDTPSQGSYDSGTGVWAVGSLAGSATATLDITVQVNASSVDNFAQVTRAQAADPDSQPAENPLGPGNPPDQDDEAVATVTAAPVADLAISKTDGGATTTPGGTVTYTLTVSNSGGADATGAVISETVPANSTFNAGASSAGWTCSPDNNAGSTCTNTVGTVTSGGTVSSTFAVTVANPVPTGTTQVTNTATVSDDGSHGVDPTPGNNTSSDNTPITTAMDISVVKSDGGATATPGSTVTYSITATNGGNVGVTGVVLTETVPANSTFNAGASSAGWACLPNNNAGSTCTLTVGGLAGGGSSAGFNFAVTVANPVPAGMTQLSNTVTIADDGANGADGTPGNNTSTDTTPVTASPDLTITKSDGGASATPGGTTSYTLSYQNVGDQDATGVVITETVPTDTTFNAAASSAGWVCVPDTNAGSTCTITIGSVAAGAPIATRTFAVAVADPLAAGVSQISNTATIADDGANGADPSPANNVATDTTPVDAAPDLSIVKSDGGASTTPGGTVTYSLQVTNSGNQGATGVVVTETVPSNTTFNPGLSSAGWTCAPDGNAGSICTNTIGALSGAGATTTLDFGLTVANLIPAGVNQVANTASVADDGGNGPDPTPGDNTSSDTTPITTALDLTITKSDGGATTTPGGTVIYTLDYANDGNVGATGVVLTETVPANSTFDPGSSTAGWSCLPDDNAGSTCTLTVGALAGGGASGTATFAVAVVNPVPAGTTQISNTVLVGDDGANGADANPANNTASDTTPVTADPDVVVSKTDGGVTTTPGGTVAYTITYTNNGDEDATGVSLVETVPANTTFDAAGSTAGWGCVPNGNAGSTCTLTIAGPIAGGGGNGSATFAVTVDNPLPGGVTQIANAVVADFPCSTGTCTSPPGTDTTPVTSDPNITVSKTDGGITTTPGATVPYAITYTNNGNAAAASVTLTETVPANTTFDAAGSTAGWGCAPNGNAGSTCTLTIAGPIAGGGGNGSATFAVTVDNPLPAGVTQLTNAVVADFPCSTGTCTSPPGTDTTPVTSAPDLSIVKSDGGASTTPGGTVVYGLTVTNNGTIAATGVTVNETVPANSTFNAGASTLGWTCAPNNNAGSTCTFDAGTLSGGGASTVVNFAVTVDTPIPGGVTQIANTAVVTDDGDNGTDPTPDDNTSSDSTPIVSAVDLTVSKSDGGAATTPGGTVVYTIGFSNDGNVGATGVVLTETVPANSTFDSGSSSPGWTCSPDNNAGSTCTLNVGSFGAGSLSVATFGVTTVSPLPIGVTQLSNTVTISDDGTSGPDANPTNNTSTDTTPITAAPNIVVSKDDGGITAQPGGSVDYAIQYTNSGDQDVAGVVIHETVPDHTTFNPGGSTAGWTCVPDNSATAACTLAIAGTIAGNGGSGVVHFVVTVDNPLPAGVTQLTNAVTGTWPCVTSTCPSPPGTDTTPLSFAPDLSVTKDDSGVSVAAGGSVAYTITYANNGNIASTNVTLTETVPANTAFNSGASTAGWVCAPDNSAGATCTLNVGTVPGGGAGGTATFAVTVDSPLAGAVTQIDNTVTIDDDHDNGDDPNPDDNTGTDATPVVQSLIGDTVFLDLDGNGVQDPGDTGLDGVTVTLLQDADNNGSYETTVGTTVTAGGGLYSFTSLPPGVYRAVVTVPAGFSNSTPTQVDHTSAADEVFADADFGILGATIGDHVFRDSVVNGVFDNGSDSNLVGATVELHSSGGALLQTTVTDGNGDYHFRGLPAGDYNVTFVPPAGMVFTRPNATSDNLDSDANVLDGTTGVFSVAAGATNNDMDAGLYFPTDFSGKVYQDLNNNGAVDPGEAGIPGATITITGTDDLGNPVNVSTTTNGSGDWALTVRTGTYTITETQPAGFLDGKDTVGAQGGTPSNDQFSNIVLGEGNPGSGYLFGEVPPSSFAGTVFDDADGDGTQDPGDPGIPGATVTLTGTDWNGNPVNTSTGTDGSGVFTFANLLPGTYTITETQPGGFVDGRDTVGSVPGTLGNDVVSSISLPVGTSATGYTFAELRTGSIGDRVWSDTSGDGIQDPGEGNLPNVTVNLSGTDVLGNAVNQSTTTNASGIYSFTNLVAGSYTVTVDTATTPPGSTSTTTNPRPVTLDEGELNTDTDFGFAPAPPPTGAIGDTVWSDTNGNGSQDPGEPGLGGVLVTLLQDADSNGSYETTVTSAISSGAGTYGFPGLPAGLYRVVVTPPSGLANTTPTTVDVNLGANAVRNDVDFGFQPPPPPAPGTIGDTVFSDTNGNGVQDPGEPGVVGATVTLRQDTNNDGIYETVGATQISGANGAYSFGNLPPGQYQVVLTVPNGQNPTTPTSIAVPLISGQSVDTADFGVRATPAPTGTIGDFVWSDNDGDGVQDPGEPGLDNITVTLRQDTNGDGTYETTVGTTTTDASGNYSFANLPPGSYSVAVTTGGLSPTTSPVVLVPLSGGDAVDTADFGLNDAEPPAGSIGDRVWSDIDRDTVQDGTEPGLNGVTVTLFEDSDGDGTYETTVATTTTSGNGNYDFINLPPGRYLTVVTPPTGMSPTTTGSVATILAPNQVVTDTDFGLATPPQQPFDLQLDKSADGSPVAGGNVVWHLAIRNNGIVATPNPIVVTDVLPNGLTYVSFTGTGWSCAANGQTVTCTLPQSLPVNGSSDLRISTQITADPGTVITNNASVSAAGVELTLANNADAAAVTIVAAPTTTTTSTTQPTPTTVPVTPLPVTGSNSSTRLAWIGLLLLGMGGLLLLARARIEQRISREDRRSVI